MKLLIIGATGLTGKEMIKQTVAKCYTVTALVREESKGSFASSVKKIKGDVLDLGSLKEGLTDQEAVISALGSAATGPFKEMTMLSEGPGNLVTAKR